WGSRSTTSTRLPSAATQDDRFTQVVVLPTPPFWFAIATTFAMAHPPFFVLAGRKKVCRLRLYHKTPPINRGWRGLEGFCLDFWVVLKFFELEMFHGEHWGALPGRGIFAGAPRAPSRRSRCFFLYWPGGPAGGGCFAGVPAPSRVAGVDFFLYWP